MLVESGEDIQARKFESVSVRLSPKRLLIGDASYDPGQVKRVEIVTDHITLPREAVGLGLVKLSGLIGAFLGRPGTAFAIVSGGKQQRTLHSCLVKRSMRHTYCTQC